MIETESQRHARVMDQTCKILEALNEHLDKTNCKHCKKVLRSVFEV